MSSHIVIALVMFVGVITHNELIGVVAVRRDVKSVQLYRPVSKCCQRFSDVSYTVLHRARLSASYMYRCHR